MWLANNSALYQQEGITVNQTWRESLNEQEIEGITNKEAMPDDCNSDDLATTENADNSKNDNFSEDEAEIPAGVTDTILTATDFLDDNERQQIHNVAPGEGNRPLSIFRDQYSEELAYPGMFLVQKRTDDKERLTSIYYRDICKSELRSDRRAAKKHLFAMIRQLGPATFFCSFSSAETKWIHLL